MPARCALFLWLILGAAVAWTAEPVARYENGVVSISAENATLASIFESLAAAMPLSVHSGQELNRRITIDVVNQRFEQVVRRLLRQTSYTLVQADGQGRFEIWIFADGDFSGNHLIIGAASEFTGESIDDASAWNQATAGLLDADSETRIEALFTLADIDAAAATDLMRVALSDSEQAVRTAAIELLGDAGAVSILQQSWWQLPSSDQILVVDALGDIETPESSSFLRVVARSNNVVLAEAATQYLDERP